MRFQRPEPLSINDAKTAASTTGLLQSPGLITPSTATYSLANMADYSKSGLLEVPPDIPTNTQLLNLSSNMLMQLPAGFGRTFSSLQTLDLSGNQISVLPDGISHLSSLRELDISKNALIALPTGIGSLRALEILDVSENYLVSMEMSMSRLENLRMLNISDNRLTSLPLYLGRLASTLRILLVDGNPFDKSQRDLIEPILTVSSKEAKRIAKTKEKAEKQRQKAAKKGNRQQQQQLLGAATGDSSLHSTEYLTALRRLVSFRIKKSHHKTPAEAEKHPRAATAINGCPNRDSAVIPVDAVAAQLGNGLSISNSGSCKPDSALSPTPPEDHATTDITADSARSVALDIARRIAVAASSNATDQHDTASIHSHRSRHNSMMSGTISSRDPQFHRASIISTSQESTSSSFDDAPGLIQDAVKVSRVLWRLCDEWDLDPQHSQADSVEHMLQQLRNGNVRLDGAIGIDRVYREKSMSAGNTQRMKILSELLVTEVTYVDTLKNVVGVYLNPMRENKVLSETELRDIFSNIEVILSFHNDHFLPAITYAISQPNMAIGKIFLHHGAHFRLYSMYTNNHDASTRVLTDVLTRRSVSAFIESARHDVTQIGQVGLNGHLLTPVQRLPRYRMLLIDLLSNTPASHSDHEHLYMALKELNRTIFEVNEKKRLFENQSRLRKIQEKVSGSIDIPLMAPHRIFRQMANFKLTTFTEPVIDKSSGRRSVRRIGVGTVYRFFLFNDMIMQCTIIMNKDLRVNRVYYLGTRVTPAEITCDHELRIVDLEGVLYLKGDKTDIRRWAHDINSRLEG